VSVADEAKTAEPPEDAPEEPAVEKAAVSRPESDQVAPPTHAKRRRRGRRGGRRRGRKPADRQAQDRTGNALPPAAAAEAETSDVDNVIPLPGPDAPTAGENQAKKKSARQRKAKDPAKRSGGIKTKKAETAAKTEASAADKDDPGDEVNPATGKPARRPRRSAKTKQAKPTGEKTVINIPIQTADEASPLATAEESSVPARQAAASTGVDGAKTNVINIGGVAGENQVPREPQTRKGWWNKPAK
jgi:ribonuclease E